MDVESLLKQKFYVLNLPLVETKFYSQENLVAPKGLRKFVICSLQVIQIDGQQKLKYYYSPPLGVIIWNEPFYLHFKVEQLLFVIVFKTQQGFTKALRVVI